MAKKPVSKRRRADDLPEPPFQEYPKYLAEYDITVENAEHEKSVRAKARKSAKRHAAKRATAKPVKKAAKKSAKRKK